MSKTKAERKNIAEQFDARNLNAKMSMRVLQLENNLELIVDVLEETRTMVSILVSAIDALKIKGVVTDAEIKEQLTKFVTDANKKDNNSLDTDTEQADARRETELRLSQNEQTISTSEGDREPDDDVGNEEA